MYCNILFSDGVLGLRFPFRHDCNWRLNFLGHHLCHILALSKSLSGSKSNNSARRIFSTSACLGMVRIDMDFISQYYLDFLELTIKLFSTVI
jgi:hypothetical protein